jgi:L-aspartate oxidase
MKGLSAETDFVVIGAGVAGLRAAIELAPAGRVLVLAKKEIEPTAPGAQVTALSDEDQVSLHLQDTLGAGDGLCNAAAVKILLEQGPERIEEVVAWGKPAGTKLIFALESSHGPRNPASALRQGRVPAAPQDCAV